MMHSTGHGIPKRCVGSRQSPATRRHSPQRPLDKNRQQMLWRSLEASPTEEQDGHDRPDRRGRGLLGAGRMLFMIRRKIACGRQPPEGIACSAVLFIGAVFSGGAFMRRQQVVFRISNSIVRPQKGTGFCGHHGGIGASTQVFISTGCLAVLTVEVKSVSGWRNDDSCRLLKADPVAQTSIMITQSIDWVSRYC